MKKKNTKTRLSFAAVGGGFLAWGIISVYDLIAFPNIVKIIPTFIFLVIGALSLNQAFYEGRPKKC